MKSESHMESVGHSGSDCGNGRKIYSKDPRREIIRKWVVSLLEI